MTLHYHGTPITPRFELNKLAGKSFCVSFARPDDLNFCLKNGQSVMLDNGAFSFFTKKKKADWYKFYNYLEPILGHPHWAIIPDVIGGGEEENDQLLKEWFFPPELSANVWHLDEPSERLIRLSDMGMKVCFGSSGDYWQIGSEKWCRRVDLAFNALSKIGQLPWIHMLRGMAVSHLYPFASVDSTNVARNFKNNFTCPEYMARRIDAVQGGTKWQSRAIQGDLL